MVTCSSFHKPLALTMGCPVGIGPELVLKLFSQGAPDIVVVGDPAVLARCATRLDGRWTIVPWLPGQEIIPGTLPVYCPEGGALAHEGEWGKPTSQTGKAMGRYIEEGVALIQAGVCSGMVTCPITKTALNAGGYHFPGHTEMLAHLCSTSEYGMMMAGASLKVTLVTIHTPLAAVADQLSSESVFAMIRRTYNALHVDFGLESPRVAVAGLNPHAGEDGMFGDEEIRIIAPAIHRAQTEGMDIDGPFPPDTVFNKAVNGEFDAVVCMYHDQGLIPFKLLHFSDGVNVTFGLPIVRTSVDHGTAYDIAGRGVADPASLIAACEMARQIVANRQGRRL
jgi:4-hydroxythreonine-4-phosphate dehydrogenase